MAELLMYCNPSVTARSNNVLFALRLILRKSFCRLRYTDLKYGTADPAASAIVSAAAPNYLI
jgi:hypothetical protein